jgi:membrane associated rhomboid family serine protease
VAAIGVTIAYWSGWNIDLLLINSKAFRGEPWRLVTSSLPHINSFHLLFNLYWLVYFGKLAEPRFGWWRTAGLYSLFAGTSAAAEYAVSAGGIGLSGVGYGLFALFWVLSRRETRLKSAIDAQITWIFVGWFFLCVILTALDVWQVGNVAHLIGAVTGGLVGLGLNARSRRGN